MSDLQFPEGDNEFEEHVLDKVEAHPSGSFDVLHDGFGIGIPAGSGVTPEVGQTARFYGRGLGSRVRGLFINGHKVWYRTPAEDEEHNEIELYGKDATEWLDRWDSDRSVFSIEMGGMGPGYEQAIQVTAAEILRFMLERKFDHSAWKDQAAWQRDREEIEAYGFKNKTIESMGLSGAQWGAAFHLASQLYKRGPRDVLKDQQVKDRHIQVRRKFP